MFSTKLAFSRKNLYVCIQYCPKTDLQNYCIMERMNIILRKFKIMEQELLKNVKNIERFRSEYLPPKIQLLLVGEAPPDASDRFFYYPNVKTNDWLFIAILKAFSGENAYQKYIEFRKDNDVSVLKTRYLNELKNRGIYLMDLSSFPAGKITPESQKNTFLKSLEKLVKNGTMDKDTPILLIKKSVYECLYKVLINNEYCVLNQGVIPFPSRQQKKFNELFLKTLKTNEISIKI